MDYSKEKIIDAIISEVKENQDVEILTDKKPYKSAFKIVWKGSQTGYHPDVITISKQFTHLFSIETSIENKITKANKEKWKIFSIYAKAKKGHLYIVGPKKTINEIEKQLEEEVSNVKYLEIV